MSELRREEHMEIIAEAVAIRRGRAPRRGRALAKDGREVQVEDALAAARTLLEYVGEDPDREGLRDTPRRVLSALLELTRGYDDDPAEHLAVTFGEATYDEMVVVRGIEFTSLCEHHLLAFRGRAAVGYVPSGRVVGLSKLARVVRLYAERLQVQERLTAEVADALVEHLSPKGVGVLVEATHSCMSARGVRAPATMVTSALRGVLLERPEARAEFLRLAQG